MRMTIQLREKMAVTDFSSWNDSVVSLLGNFLPNDDSVSHSFILLWKNESLVINESLAILMVWWHLILYSSYSYTVSNQSLDKWTRIDWVNWISFHGTKIALHIYPNKIIDESEIF